MEIVLPRPAILFQLLVSDAGCGVRDAAPRDTRGRSQKPLLLRLAVAALAAEIGARVIWDALEQEWMIARASWQGSLSAGNAVNSARISDDGIFYSCKRVFLLVVRLIGSLSVSLGSQGEISS